MPTWLTYDEIAERRRISRLSAHKLVRRNKWERRPMGHGSPLVQVLVPPTRSCASGRSSALPIVGAQRPGGSAPNAPRSSAADQRPGLPSAIAFRGVRAGTLDDTSCLRATAHFWTRSAQPWVLCCLRTGRGSRHSQWTR